MVQVFRFGKKKRVEEKKTDEPPKDLIENFDEYAYLEANPDVKKGIEKGDFKNVKHHLETFGLNEIEKGLRQFHKDCEVFDKDHYFEKFPEVKVAIENFEFDSTFDHFCKIGYTALIESKIESFDEDQELNENYVNLLKNLDIDSYLEANQEVNRVIKEDHFPNVDIYLKQFGLKRIEEGKERFHKNYDYFNEILYIECLPDVGESIEEGKFDSAFHHFTSYGYSEIINGTRKYSLNEVKLSDLLDLFKSKNEYYNFCTTFNIKSVDIILPVYNALDDVEKCIHSVFDVASYPFHLIVIDDHSDESTKSYLQNIANEKNFELIRNEKNLRFTKSVNKGFEKSKADISILLNSDTIVTKNWIEKIITCFNSNTNIGIVGPLSNAASWQTVPVRENPTGGWLVNDIPEGYSVEKMSELVETISQKIYPKVPSVNGFCYAIKRDLLDLNGNLDEEYFPTGYGEEDDFSIRARDAGYDIVVADDTYIFHAKSKSYTHEVRAVLTEGGRKSLDKKHGKEKIEKLIQDWKDETNLPHIAQNIDSYMHISSGNKKVVYTAIFGEYDGLKNPEYINEDWDYICFTDNRNIKSDVYIVKYVDPIFEESVRNARMIKILPHLFLIGYDYSLWIDGSVRLRGRNINNLIKEMSHKNNYIFLHEHIKRDCAYDEGMACILSAKDEEYDILPQMKFYKSLMYPDKNGLVETAEILRAHNDPRVITLNKEWWSNLSQHSFRDQLSFNYACWKNDVRYGKMLGYQWKDQFFTMFKHGNNTREVSKSSLTVLLLLNQDNKKIIDTIVMSLLKKTVCYSRFNVLIVDVENKLKNKKLKVLAGLNKRIIVVGNSKNRSEIDIVNYYAGKFKNDYFMVVNDSIKVMTRDWMSRLSVVLDKNDHCIAVGPTLFDREFMLSSSSIKVDKKSSKQDSFVERTDICGTGVVNAVNLYGALINIELFKKVGGLDKEKSLHNSFVKLCTKSEELGYEVRFEADSEVVLYTKG